MKIIAHRGYWKNREEGNTLKAFEMAFQKGYGIETDIRDYKGKLVISHNPADENCPEFKSLLEIYVKYDMSLPLALNVKADGIQGMLKRELEAFGVRNYFMFDMSVPEQVVYVRDGFNTFGRQSEYERNVSMYEFVEGVWMDEFSEEWMNEDDFQGHIRNNKKMGIISSEIHGNDKMRLWKIIDKFKDCEAIMLCTDTPDEAKEYFDE